MTWNDLECDLFVIMWTRSDQVGIGWNDQEQLGLQFLTKNVLGMGQNDQGYDFYPFPEFGSKSGWNLVRSTWIARIHLDLLGMCGKG